MSANFLVQILNDLKRGELIVSRRGKAGGYLLNQAPKNITLLQIVEAVRHLRSVCGEMRALTVLLPEELAARAKELRAPLELVRLVARTGILLAEGRFSHSRFVLLSLRMRMLFNASPSLLQRLQDPTLDES